MAALPPATGSPEADPPLLALRWFIRLRWIFVGAAVGALLLERTLSPSTDRPLALVLVLVGLAVVNVVWDAFTRRGVGGVAVQLGGESGPAPSSWLANAQVAVDLLALTLILRFAGGVENPFAVCYVFHMVIGSLLLPGAQAAAQGVWAALLYGALCFGELAGWIDPHFALLPTMAASTAWREPTFVLMVWLATVVGIFGTLYVTQYIANRLRAHERALENAVRALRASQAAIEGLQRRRSRFMQTAAHQLKSPLASIRTLVGLIQDGLVEGEAVTATCVRVADRCQQGIAEVGELLTLARIQDADPARHAQAHSQPGQVVAELSGRYASLAQQKGIRLTCDVAPDADAGVRVDPRDLADCLGNLIDNAIKYTNAPGEVTLTVTRAPPSRRSPAGLCIEVADTGIGIEPELLRCEGGDNPIFEAYRRGNRALAAGIPGSGLGLTIVRTVVDQAHGKLRVSSVPGAGTRFTLWFPRADSESGTAGPVARGPAGAAAPPSARGVQTCSIEC